ncbi:MAG: transposase, partial [Actinobacteria bacterium]|nr:transposase [Actinomycetota bacterium]
MPALPVSLVSLLSLLRPAFTVPSFQTFEALVAGFAGRVGEHTVTGMWQAARLAGRVHHSRAHDFFARARWSLDELGLLVLDFLVSVFVDRASPLRLAVDGTFFDRSGRRVHGACWQHDPHAAGKGALRFGNSFVVVGLLVRIPRLGERTWCLPLLFRLWLPTPKPTKSDPQPRRRPSQQQLAAGLIELVAARYPGRRIDVVGDAAFACKALAALPKQLTLTARLRSNAAIYAPAPPRTGKRGRPRTKGERLGDPRELARAGASQWRTVTVPGRGEARVRVVAGLWYSVFGSRPVQVVLAREPSDRDGYRIALISTDTDASPAQLLVGYDERWSIETCFQDAKHVVGIGEARNRIQAAVERTVPFGFLCQTLVAAWYALHGRPDEDVKARRRHAPWYRDKRNP